MPCHDTVRMLAPAVKTKSSKTCAVGTFDPGMTCEVRASTLVALPSGFWVLRLVGAAGAGVGAGVGAVGFLSPPQAARPAIVTRTAQRERARRRVDAGSNRLISSPAG